MEVTNGLQLGFNRFHVLTEKPGEMTPVRRVGGVVRNLDLNSPVILDPVVGSEDTVNVLTFLIIAVGQERLAVGSISAA